MSKVSVRFNERAGKVKPMHAVNNGPVGNSRTPVDQQDTNMKLFRDAGIPYARTHDAAFLASYGGEHTVDIYAVFPNFDADVNDPASYDFACTDEYLKCIQLVGTKVFYRLGSKIDHRIKKYDCLPPKDNRKWAEICEHIIRHYTEGWADGFHFDMEYWEIWNEPDLHWNNENISPTWSGTPEEFFQLYHVAATHLKACFPHLKIGGPAIAGSLEWAEMFLAQLKAPLDFFSWHVYAANVEKIAARAEKVRELLDRYGYGETESILNEWNYVKGWVGEDIRYSHEQKARIKGAAFNLATMCECQRGSVDLLMYYDARCATAWNGLFDYYRINRPLKPYYPFVMFNELYKMGNAVACEAEGENLYATAAVGEDEAAVLVAHFNDDDAAGAKTVSVELVGFPGEKGTVAEVFLLDKAHNLESVERITFFGDRLILERSMENFACSMIKLKKI